MNHSLPEKSTMNLKSNVNTARISLVLCLKEVESCKNESELQTLIQETAVKLVTTVMGRPMKLVPDEAPSPPQETVEMLPQSD